MEHSNIDAEGTACHSKVCLMAGSLSTNSKYHVIKHPCSGPYITLKRLAHGPVLSWSPTQINPQSCRKRLETSQRYNFHLFYLKKCSEVVRYISVSLIPSDKCAQLILYYTVSQQNFVIAQPHHFCLFLVLCKLKFKGILFTQGQVVRSYKVHNTKTT